MRTKETILKQLIAQLNQFVSGEELATTLHLSRTSIWRGIHELIYDGYEISSSTKKSYCLSTPSRLSKEVLEHWLEKTPIQRIELKETTDSTQKDAKRLALDSSEQEILVISGTQTETRGRFGRSYFSPEGGEFIAMSLLTRPNTSFEEVSQYTLLAAVSVVKAIETLTKQQPLIKWVNDIYLNGKKICGILSEAITDIESHQITSVIVGIGINFSIPQEKFPSDLQQKATSLFPAGTPTITKNELIAEVWKQFYQLAATDFIEIYRQYSFVFGKRVSFIEKEIYYTGIAQQITNTGELVVFLDNGKTKLLRSGEISLTSIR